MFLIQLTVQQKRHELATYRAPAIPFSQKLVRSFVDSLPFALTNGQRQAAWEILQDLAKKTPMNRLLEGDVGSGKTLVAAIALLEVAINGRQGVIMVPTEVLALQHFKNFAQLFKNYDLNIGLLTNAHQKMARKGVEKNNKLIRAAIGRGRASIAIGTHSLIQEKVTYRDLALVVVDEQHRFGVAQRQALHDKTPNQIPHFLSMTATPIPRTLALTLYGDLDISLITELPKHRKPVKTFYIPPQKRAGAYDFIRKEIKSDRQVFVICPLIEESDKLGVRAATLEQEKLSRTVFPDLKIGLLHGQMKPDVKQRVMKNFVDGKTDILVSTAVVEVGVDVPNATVMLIEGAERFGLSQLHQFRGRVGRSRYQSYCFLFTDSTSENTKKRLEALIKSRNGFELAEYDLRQRGPGEVLGTKQSGFPELKVASLTDLSLIKAAREEATKLVATNLSSYPQLYEKISAWQKKIHWE
jgi:ATP-dependent DNA helicase RecG